MGDQTSHDFRSKSSPRGFKNDRNGSSPRADGALQDFPPPSTEYNPLALLGDLDLAVAKSKGEGR